MGKKSIVAIMLIVGSMIISNNINGENCTFNEPNWGKTYNQTSLGNNIDVTRYAFPVYRGDNISIYITSLYNVKYGSASISFGIASSNGDSYISESNLLVDNSSNMTDAINGFINRSSIINLPYSFWLISGSTQNVMISIITIGESSIEYSINKINSTTSSNPEIEELQYQIKDLTTNLMNAQTQIQHLTQLITDLNSTMAIMNKTNLQILDNITFLWNSYNQLNITLHDFLVKLETLNTSSVQDIIRIEQIISDMESDLTDIYNQIEKLSTNKTDINNLQNQINQTIQDIKKTNDNMIILEKSIPDNYNDTALKSQINQLIKENIKLRQDIDTLNKTKQEKNVETQADDLIIYGAYTIGVLALLISIFVLISKNRKSIKKR